MERARVAGEGGGAAMLSLLSLLSPQFEKVSDVNGGLSNESGRPNTHDRLRVVDSSTVDGARVDPFNEICRFGRVLPIRKEGASVEKRFAFSAKLAEEPGDLDFSRFRLVDSLLRLFSRMISVFSLVDDSLLRLFSLMISVFSWLSVSLLRLFCLAISVFSTLRVSLLRLFCLAISVFSWLRVSLLKLFCLAISSFSWISASFFTLLRLASSSFSWLRISLFTLFRLAISSCCWAGERGAIRGFSRGTISSDPR